MQPHIYMTASTREKYENVTGYHVLQFQRTYCAITNGLQKCKNTFRLLVPTPLIQYTKVTYGKENQLPLAIYLFDDSQIDIKNIFQ